MMSALTGMWQWLPTRVDARVRLFAWASLVSQILIIGTGGAVRLTESGLGCPTWPRCTEDSFVSTPEMGWHGVIEFGNRLLTFLLVIIAIGMFAMIVRMRTERPELLRLSVALGLGIPAGRTQRIYPWGAGNPRHVTDHLVVDVGASTPADGGGTGLGRMRNQNRRVMSRCCSAQAHHN